MWQLVLVQKNNLLYNFILFPDWRLTKVSTKNNENNVTYSYAVLAKGVKNMEPIWRCLDFLSFVFGRSSIILVSNLPNRRPKGRLDPEFWTARWTKRIFEQRLFIYSVTQPASCQSCFSLFDNISPMIYLVCGVPKGDFYSFLQTCPPKLLMLLLILLGHILTAKPNTQVFMSQKSVLSNLLTSNQEGSVIIQAASPQTWWLLLVSWLARVTQVDPPRHTGSWPSCRALEKYSTNPNNAAPAVVNSCTTLEHPRPTVTIPQRCDSQWISQHSIITLF